MTETRNDNPTRELSIDLAALDGFGLDLDQYLGPWAIDEGRFLLLFDQVARMDLAAHVRSNQGHREIAAARVSRETGGDVSIAVIDIRGTLTKQGSSLSSAGSTVRIRRAVRQAANDPDVDAVLLRIDSPGGTVAGTAELAREIAAADRKKPVFAFVEDLTASGAYWLASQARAIYANERTALIGSIGTYTVLYDLSGFAAQKGIRPVVIRSGEFKGLGTEGTEITAREQAHIQERVDKMQSEFSAGIARGRKMPLAKVEELADGAIHLAEDARALGLIDGIQTFDDTLGQLSQLAAKRTSTNQSNRSMSTMSEDNAQTMTGTLETADLRQSAPQAAGFDELVAALPGATNDFLIEAQKKKFSVEQARDAWTGHLQEQIAAKDQQIADAKTAAVEQAKKKAAGVEPLGGASGGQKKGSSYDDPVATFDQQVRERMKAGLTRRRAILAVARADRDLHEAYLRATNAGHSKVQGLIGERFELVG